MQAKLLPRPSTSSSLLLLQICLLLTNSSMFHGGELDWCCARGAWPDLAAARIDAARCKEATPSKPARTSLMDSPKKPSRLSRGTSIARSSRRWGMIGRARCGYRGSEGEEKRNIYLGTKLGGRHWAVSADIGRTHVHFPQTDKNSTFKDKIWGRSLEML